MPLMKPRSTRFSNFSRNRGRIGRRHKAWDHRSSRPRLELLEERMLLAVNMVGNSNSSGPGSLPFVIANSSAGDTIEFDMANVTSPITLTGGELDITHNLKIEGPGAGNLTIAGGLGIRVFNVSSGVSATISGLTIADGDQSFGGGLVNYGQLKLTGDVFSDNSGTTSGGAICNRSGTLSMTGCTVANNNSADGSGGGLYIVAGVVTIQNSTFEGNQSENSGGAIENAGGTLSLINSTIANNTAGEGGGINNDNTTTLINCTVAGNNATLGGGICNSGTTVNLANTIVADNSSSDEGPDYFGGVADSGNNLIGNDSDSSGFTQSSDLVNVDPVLGGLANYGGPTQTMALMPGSPAIDAGNNTLVPAGIETDQRGFYRFANGTVDIGAFEVQDYQVFNTHDSGPGSLRSALTNANLAGASNIFLTTSGTITLLSALPAISQDVNMIGPGANVLAVDGNDEFQVFVVQEGVTATILGLTVSDGYSAGNGGGIENDGTLFLTNCAVFNSTTANDGGGIENDDLGTLTLTGCTVSGNSSPNDGGGIGNSGTLIVINSTIAGNMASSGVGGGINNAGAMTLINDTVGDNTAYDGGGIQSGGSATLANTIVAYNALSGGGSGPDFNGNVTTDAGNNLIGETDGSTGWGGSDLTGTVAQPLDPLLSALGNYGGPTETLALLPGSPAVDAGDNALIPGGITTDQRGLSRIVHGTVDIGAVECQGFTITVVSGNNQSATVNTAFTASLGVLVTSSHGDPIAGGLVIYTVPESGASATLSTYIATTNLFGVAGVTATANSQAGSYSVVASTFGAPSAASFSMTNTAGMATKLAFLQQPTDTTYGDSISPAVTVEVEDESGNLVSSTASITIALDTNPTSGLLGGTTTVSAIGGIATFSTLTVSLAGTGYTLEATSSDLAATPASSSFTITARPITVTAAANTKTYDGTTSAAATPTVTSGTLVGGDTPDFTEAYSGKNAGTGLTLTPSGTVDDGNGGDNYDVTFDSVSTGVITAYALTITGVANTKGYDATTSAAAVPEITSGSLQGSDTANFIETYSTPNVGTGLTLTPGGTVNDGNDGNNYTYTFVPDDTGVITAEALTITAADDTKVYDGTTIASGVPTITSGSLQGSDTGAFIETYSTQNVGSGLTLTPSGVVNDGNGGDNYTYTFDSVSTGVITAEALTITAVADTKVYDGTTSAAGVPTIASGSLQGSDTADFIETYSTQNVGSGLTLTPSGMVSDGNDGNNYSYTFVPVSTGVITAEALTIMAVTNSKVYDATTSAAGVPTIASGSLQGSDTADFIEAYSSPNAGTGLTLTPSGTVADGNDGNNYTYTFVPDSMGVITAEALTITAVTDTKVYDATTSAATLPEITSGSLQGSDTANFIETYSTQNVGSDLTLTPSGTVNDGNDGNNYSYTFVPDSTGVITAEALTITAVTDSKVYDGTTSAAGVPTITSGSLQGSDTANFIETYSTQNVGSDLTLTPSGTVNDGNDGNNYTYTFVPDSTGVITAEALTIMAVTNSKVYDGTTSAAGVPSITAGSLQGSDTADFIETYSTRNVGVGLVLTPSGTVDDGNGGGNYTYTFLPDVTGSITVAALTITAMDNTKVYDATTSAAGVPTITSGGLGTGDTADFIETYSTQNVGSGLTLTPSGMVSDGNDGNNYSYTFVPVSTGVITAEALTIMAVTNSKVYDATTSAAGVPTIASGSLQGSDTADFIEAYSSPNAGTGLTLTPSGTVADGNDGNNYSYTFVPVSTGVITAEALTITAVTNSKVYDATTSAAGVPTIASGSLQGSDTADFIEAYSSPNAGTGLTLTPSGTVADGNGGNNYTYTFVPDSTGVITAEALTITAVTDSKVYDGTTSAAGVPLITAGSLQGSDTADFIETYSTRNVGVGLVLTPSGTVDDGNGGGNYTYTFLPDVTGSITVAALTITAMDNTKVYDATTSAAGVPTITSGGLGTGDTADFIETYSTQNVGSGLTLTPSGMVSDGNDGNNYSYTFVPVLTGVITAEALTIMAVTNSKVYDATTSAAGVPTIASGSLQGSDTADFIEAYSSPNAGTGLTLTPSGTVADGNDGNNYSYTFVPDSTGVITAEALTITAVTDSKVYDGTTSAAGVPTITSGSLQGSDTANFIETYSTQNVGSDLTLTPSGTVNDGNDGNNYTYTFVPDSTGVITAEALTIMAVTNSKVYDGTTSAAGVPLITAGSLQGSDTADFIETYSTRNVGVGLVLTPSGTVDDGNGGGNYTYTFLPDVTGSITVAALTITAMDNTKVYDATTSAAGVPTITSGGLGTDDTADFIETYSTQNVGSGLTLTPSGMVSDGNDGNNYSYTFVPVFDGSDHGRGADDHGGHQQQGLRRHDECGGRAHDRVRQSARLGHGRLHRGVQQPECGHGVDADTQRYCRRRQRRQQLHVHVRAGVDGSDHGRGADDHGGHQQQGLRRHDECGGRAHDRVRQSARLGHGRLHRGVQQPECGHGVDADTQRYCRRRQRRQQLHVHVRAGLDGSDHGRGADDHGGNRQQGLRRDDERRGRAIDHCGEFAGLGYG